MKRILIAGVVGGVVMFMWGAFCHMVLPISSMAVKSLPNETAIVPVLQREIREHGLYFFPGMDMTTTPTAEQQAEWERRYNEGPVGILVYQPTGYPPLSGKQLLNELISNILAAFIVAWVFVLIGVSLGRGALIGGLLGLFAWLTLSASYWNWYGFPGFFLLNEAVDQVVGWALAGLVIALIVRRRVAPAV